jgi:hypothetical protein
MDMYRILESFDAVNSRATVSEGEVKRAMHADADKMSRAEFVDKYGAENGEFWDIVRGDDDEELDEERRSEEEFDADALAKQKARLAREKQKIMMQRKISGQDSGEPPVVRDMSEAEDEAGTDPTNTKHEGDQGYGDASRGINKNPYGPNTPAGRAYQAGQAAFQRDFGDIDQERRSVRSRAGYYPMREADVEEGNRFAYNVLKAKAAGKKQADLDGDGDMEKVQEVFPGTPEYELRFGKDDASSAFDKKKISTGTVYSRKHFDEPESDDDTPKSAGRPKGTGRKLGAKGPSVASKLLKGKGGLKEHDHEHGMDMHMHNSPDRGEYDQEGKMARQDLHTMVDAAKELHAILGSDENLPEWVQSKITKALDYIDTARDYMQSVDADRGEEVNEFAPIVAPVVGALGRAAVAGAASGAVQSAIGDDDVAEAGYSAKSARAGKDIGKPGKNFSKIAKGAAERYGSKAAGERVAGAVLNKLRHPTKEGTGDLRSSVLSVIQHIYDGASAGEEMVDDVASELGQYFSQVKKCTDKPLRKAYQMMSREGAEAEGDPEYMAQVAQKAIDLLSQPAVDEGSADKKDPPFTPDTKSSFKKSTNPNRTNRDSVKSLAQKGLADMTTAELKAELKRRSQVEEESTDTRDQHAEKAGKKVTKDLESDMKHTGKDDAKAEKAGKKVAKDIEYDDKKDKEEKVDETTVSGSVATSAGGDAPKKGKGGMQFGQGVYEGQVAESFEKKLKNVLNEGMSVNVSTDDTGKKSISVNATDSDADALGDMLKMAGLFSSEGYSSVCQDCGGIHEAGACGADMVEEELANSPDEVYTDADYMTQTLSGGLNGPKTTGQTTGAVVNRQDSRQGVMAEAGKVTEQAESRLWNLYKQYEKK